MHRAIEKLLKVSTAALILSSFLALASAPTVGPVIMIFGVLLLALWPLGEYFDGHFAGYRHITNGATALFSVTLPVWIATLGLLPAVIALIIFIEAHKLGHQKERKDYYQLFLMCFLLLIAACGLGPDAAIGIAMLCFLISAVWALWALQIRTEAGQVSPSGLADIVPLSVGQPEPTSSSPSLLDWGMVRAISMVCLASALLSAGFFFGTPRMEAGILGRSNLLTPDGAQRQTGLSDTVEIGQGGRIESDHSPVMRVKFPDIPGGQYDGELYWRSSTMDTFRDDTGVWKRTGGPFAIHDDRPSTIPLPTRKNSVVAREPSGEGRQIRQSIYLDDVPRSGLPCLVAPVRLECEGATVSWDPEQDGYFVMVDRLKSSSISYEVVSEVVRPRPQQLRNARTDYRRAISDRDFDVLTSHNLRESTLRLTQQLTEDYDNLYDKARALEAWLSSDAFVYTLDTPTLPRHAAVDAFVLEVRRGHCELFASALALMVRGLGIPTRVVSGYRGGEWSPSDQAYIVTRDMAHLWVEAYFLDYGWIRFDPSPLPDEDTVLWRQRAKLALSRWQLRAKIFWYRNIIGYEGGYNLARLKDLGRGVFTWAITPYTGWLDDKRADGSSDFLSVLVLPGMFASVVLVLLYLKLKKKLPRRGKVLTPAQRRAIRLLGRVIHVLRRQGIECTGKTAAELLVAARSVDSVTPRPVAEALERYNEARFGDRPLSKARFKELSRNLRTIL
jgi:protein-glutamine gamma-glutamyltransferase